MIFIFMLPAAARVASSLPELRSRRQGCVTPLYRSRDGIKLKCTFLANLNLKTMVPLNTPLGMGAQKYLTCCIFKFQTFNRAWKSQIEQNVRWL